MGVYHYNAYAVVGADTSKDSFMFGKLGDSGQAGMTRGDNWTNTGEPITDVGHATAGRTAVRPYKIRLASLLAESVQCHHSHQLPAISRQPRQSKDL